METNINENNINIEVKKELTAYARVHLARDTKRPKVADFIAALFDEFVELKGDRLGKEDSAILGGVALFHNIPVTVIGHKKGKTLEENMACNFGMPGPEGYRKALRLMKQAEKFNRPIITFVDTPGAYPGIKAEENGQAIAIADSIAKMSTLKVPVITVITGEGSSGGALAISVANSIIMLENAVYSILSPEGFASILWKDSSKSAKACDLMKITAKDLKNYELIDEIIAEPEGGMQTNPLAVYDALDKMLCKELRKYGKMSVDAIVKNRYQKFRKMDSAYGMVRKEAR